MGKNRKRKIEEPIPMSRKKEVFKKPDVHEELKNIRSDYDLLLPETGGYIEPDLGEKTWQISQKEIVNSVDISSATKHFDLKLNYGPYCVNYFRNGRQMLIGGSRGHVAAMDWISKKLLVEFNVMESVHAVQWLHMPVLFAVAQKDWVHIYDSKGTEMHCLKKLYQVKSMEYLPYHLLLVTASDQGFLSWTDTSYGKLVTQFRPKKVKKIMCMSHNQSNAIIFTGHSNGVVNMWTPNSQEPAIQMLTHPGAVRDVAITTNGNNMVTLGSDKSCKLWDLRALKPLTNFRLKSIGECVTVSQKGFIAVGTGNVVQIYRDTFNGMDHGLYLQHKCPGFVKNLQFSNYEDVLGIGHENGFTSILVPGAGEPNFDSFESNPFMTSAQRKEMEVKMLLDKISPELISIDPYILGKVDVKHMEEQARKAKESRIPNQYIQKKKRQREESKKKKDFSTILDRFKPKTASRK